MVLSDRTSSAREAEGEDEEESGREERSNRSSSPSAGREEEGSSNGSSEGVWDLRFFRTGKLAVRL